MKEPLKIIICSNRGGSGKTLISLGMVLGLASRGLKIVAMDRNFVNMDTCDTLKAIIGTEEKTFPVGKGKIHLLETKPRTAVLERMDMWKIVRKAIKSANTVLPSYDAIIIDTNYSVFNLSPPPKDKSIIFIMLWGWLTAAFTPPPERLIKSLPADRVYHVIPYGPHILGNAGKIRLIMGRSTIPGIQWNKIRRLQLNKGRVFVSTRDIIELLENAMMVALEDYSVVDTVKEIMNHIGQYYISMNPRNMILVPATYYKLLSLIPRMIRKNLTVERVLREIRPYLNDVIFPLARKMGLLGGEHDE